MLNAVEPRRKLLPRRAPRAPTAGSADVQRYVEVVVQARCLATTYPLLRPAYQLPLATCHPPLTTHHSPLTPHPSPLTPHHSSLATHHSPLTTHHSPLTPHASPLTTHHSPPTSHHPPLTTPLPRVQAGVDLPVRSGAADAVGSTKHTVECRFQGRTISTEIKVGRHPSNTLTPHP